MARVVVWEWLNEHGRWRPYSAAVCHHIENVLKGDARGSVVLGQVDGQLSPYIIDLQSMHQFRQDTGKTTYCPHMQVSQTWLASEGRVAYLHSGTDEDRGHLDVGLHTSYVTFRGVEGWGWGWGAAEHSACFGAHTDEPQVELRGH